MDALNRKKLSRPSPETVVPVDQDRASLLKPWEARILVIEEHATNVIILRRILERLGIDRIYTASSGVVGLNMLASSKPDIIVIDCTMEDMDGYDVTRIIREKEIEAGRGDHVPILGMTADNGQDARVSSMESGMDYCTQRPANAHELHMFLSRYIDLTPYRDGLTYDETDQLDASDLHLDLRVIAQFARTNKESALMLINAFTFQSNELLGNLQMALLDRDEAKWARNIHTMRGGAANIGAHILAHLTDFTQETMPEIERADAVLEAIRHEYDIVCERLHAYLDHRA